MIKVQISDLLNKEKMISSILDKRMEKYIQHYLRYKKLALNKPEYKEKLQQLEEVLLTTQRKFMLYKFKLLQVIK